MCDSSCNNEACDWDGGDCRTDTLGDESVALDFCPDRRRLDADGRQLVAPVAVGVGVAVARWVGGEIIGAVVDRVAGEAIDNIVSHIIPPADQATPMMVECGSVCRDYPADDQAPFCTTISDPPPSHRIMCTVKARATERDDMARRMWNEIMENAKMAAIVDGDKRCQHDMQASICLDAFPQCHCDDLTLCNHICINVNHCLNAHTDKLIDTKPLDCDELCSKSEEEGKCTAEDIMCIESAASTIDLRMVALLLSAVASCFGLMGLELCRA